MLQLVEINPQGKPEASIIWLHGLGASGYDFVDIVPELGLPPELNVRFVFPHAPIREVKWVGDKDIRAWFNIIDLEKNIEQDEKGIRDSEKLIQQLIANERAKNIPSQKIILVGFSQGGAMALQCGLRCQEKLGGILVLSAWLPLKESVASERTVTNQETPILMLHGTHDDIVPINWAQESRDYLEKMGYNVSFSSYPMRHTCCLEEIRTIGLWLRKMLS